MYVTFFSVNFDPIPKVCFIGGGGDIPLFTLRDAFIGRVYPFTLEGMNKQQGVTNQGTKI